MLKTIKQRNLNSFFTNISNAISATSYSFPLIMSHFVIEVSLLLLKSVSVKEVNCQLYDREDSFWKLFANPPCLFFPH